MARVPGDTATKNAYTFAIGTVVMLAMFGALLLTGLMSGNILAGVLGAGLLFVAFGVFQTWVADLSIQMHYIRAMAKLTGWPSTDRFVQDLKRAAKIGRAEDILGALTAFYRTEYAAQLPNHAEDRDVMDRYRALVRALAEGYDRFADGYVDQALVFAQASPFKAPLEHFIGADACRALLAHLVEPFNALPDGIRDRAQRQPYRRCKVESQSNHRGREFQWREDFEDRMRRDAEMLRQHGEDYMSYVEILDATPFWPIKDHLIGLLRAPAFLPFSQEARLQHMHILGGSGHGKSQTLQHLLMRDLAGDDAVIVIDSQGEMLPRVARLASSREVLYIDPADYEHPAALNLFDVSHLDQVSRSDRERFLNNLIQLLEFVFAGLLRAELTQKQNVLFRYALRVMLACEGTTLLDLVRFMEDPHPYLRRAQGLPMVVQEFFKTAFSGSSYNQTRTQIAQRLYGVLENDTFYRMLTSKTNRVRLTEAMERGAVVLVDTNKAHLAAEASSLLGRYFIALTLQAALERGTEAERPVWLYIDEAAEYFDESMEALLTEARKRKVGVIIAHQKLQDFRSAELRGAVHSNTAIKLAGGVSDADARDMASNMHTDKETIHSARRGQRGTQFACYVRNATNGAVIIDVPFGTMEGAKQMSEHDYLEWREANRHALSEAGTSHEEAAMPPREDEKWAEPEQAPSEPVPEQFDDISPTRDWRA